MKKLLSFIAVTVTAATAVAAGAYIVKKLEQEKDEEVKLIEIINEEESEKKTKVEENSESKTEVLKEEVLEKVCEEVPLEELVEEQIASEVTPEEVSEPTVEEVQEEIEEAIEEAEEPVEEVQEEVEEVVEEIQEPVELYPLLSDRKKTAISNQIQVMIESMQELESVDLQHYVVFPNVEAANACLAQLEETSYEIFVEENGQEVNLIKNSKLEYTSLVTEILTLAQLVAEYTGAYKGWAVKIDE